ncbi:IclR family transcriptional regulator [Leifsonia kafniensis]|uniref:IclR family transcriptional regulator n=1 Tax=Leifsonia kafniensis TaxID=475957 RepID=A0ABP7KWB9_9MICO
MSDSLHKAISILEALRLSPDGSSARVLAGETGIPKSTVQRLLQSLAETQMVVQDPQRLTYRLGPRTLMLGMAYKQGLDLGRLALPVMVELRNQTNETVGLSVAVGHERMFIEEAQSLFELRFASELGRLYPLWSGAPGRALMIDLNSREVEEIIGDALPSASSVHSPVGHDVILARLEHTRLQRHARAFNETLDNVSSLAVPIRNARGDVVAALSISGPSERLTSARMDEVVHDLEAAAFGLSRSLGGLAARLA